MAQYDLVLIQNTAGTGVDFEEKIVNLDKGCLLSAIGTTKVPTILAAGTDGYQLVRDDAEATGLKWVPATSQGGTTSNTFTVDSDSVLGKIIIDVATGAADKSLTVTNEALTDNRVWTFPDESGTVASRAYADGLFAANDAMIFKGTIGVGGTIEIAAFNSLATYNAGWTYRVITAGTIKGIVAEVGDLVMTMVDRTGTGNVDADFTVAQTNLDGAVIGPASVTDGNLVMFDTTSGKLIKEVTAANARTFLNVADGATANAKATGAEVDTGTDDVKFATAKALKDSLNVPSVVPGTAGNMLVSDGTNWAQAGTISADKVADGTTNKAYTAVEKTKLALFQVSAPAAKTSTGTVGQTAYDSNYFYQCVATDTWRRSALAQWS